MDDRKSNGFSFSDATAQESAVRRDGDPMPDEGVPINALKEITRLRVLLQHKRNERLNLEIEGDYSRRVEKIIDEMSNLESAYELFNHFLERVPHLIGRGARMHITGMSDHLGLRTGFGSRGSQVTDLSEIFRHGVHEYLLRKHRKTTMREDGRGRNFDVHMLDLPDRHELCEYLPLRIENPRFLNGDAERANETVGYLEIVKFQHYSGPYADMRGQVNKIMRAMKSHLERLQSRILIEEHCRLACEDPLTGLRNRRGFFEAVASLRKRDPDAHFSIVAADLDKFKSVNDTYGHDTGDLVLKAFSGHVGAMRAIGNHPLVAARFGGEEFVMYCHGLKMDEASRVAELVRLKAANNPVPTDAGPLTVTASLGVSGCRSPKESVEEVIGRADALLYVAKENGRNQVRTNGLDEAIEPRWDKTASDAIHAGVESNRRTNWLTILHDLMAK